MSQRRFVVLDRDGTLIFERNYLSDPCQVKLIPAVTSSLRKLSDLGLGLIVITNQSAVGRGFFNETRLDLIHRRLMELLAEDGVYLDGLYVCLHRPEDNCLCRKPMSGLLELAAKELGFDPQTCFVIGDKACDIELGRRVGATTFLVRTGYGAQVTTEGNVTSDYVVDDLADAAQIIQRLFISGEMGLSK